MLAYATVQSDPELGGFLSSLSVQGDVVQIGIRPGIWATPAALAALSRRLDAAGIRHSVKVEGYRGL